MSTGPEWSPIADRMVKGSSEEFASTRLPVAPNLFQKIDSDKWIPATGYAENGELIFPNFAARLNRLMTLVHPPGRGPYRAAEVARTMRLTSLTPVSQPYLSQLRAGTRTRPSEATVEALAEFFGIDPLYFSDDRYYQDVDGELEWLNVFRDWNVRQVATRVVGLSAESQDELVRLADELRRKEGLAGAGFGDADADSVASSDPRHDSPARMKQHV
jgi:transcriptional regulator with XRE-family HTH domain